MVQLVPLLRVRHLGDRRFDYLVPPEFEERVRLGSVVSAPFGRRVVRAVVVDMTGSHDIDGRPTSASSKRSTNRPCPRNCSISPARFRSAIFARSNPASA